MVHTRAIIRDVDRRPWALPRLPWVMLQTWNRQLFMHWPVPVAVLRPLVPPLLTIDTFEGTAYVGITPFLQTVRVRALPPIPTAADFPEVNLRTYVRVGGRAGIYFFSLDAGSALAVLTARTALRLPYYRAELEVIPSGEWTNYQSRRKDHRAELAVRYRPQGPVFEALPGTLVHFLTERYAFFNVVAGGAVLRTDLHHRPWPLQHAEAELTRNTLGAAHGIPLGEKPPLLHYSERQETLIWPPLPARRERGWRPAPIRT